MKLARLDLLFVHILILSVFSSVCFSAPVAKKSAHLNKFLTISDIHLNYEATTVQYGCDTGMKLWVEAQKELSGLLKKEKPDFILYLGDVPAHSEQGKTCPQTAISADSIHQDIGMTLQGLREIATANHVPLFYLPGNNDGYGGDYHSFTYITPEKQKITPFDLDKKAPAKSWPVIESGKHVRIESANPDLGYYSAYPFDHRTNKALRLLMLNTVIFVAQGYVSDDGVTQANAAQAQLSWMEAQLKEAKSKGEAVMIAMHVPPGNDGWSGYPYWMTDGALSPLQSFVAMVDQYHDNITGIFYSHTHLDEIKRLFNSKSELIELAVSTPGVTVQHSNNPGIKVFSYDPANFELADFKTYYALDQQSTGDFKFAKGQVYSFKQSYGGCKGASIMLDCIRNINATADAAGESKILNYMNTIYGVKSSQAGTYNKPASLDILTTQGQ